MKTQLQHLNENPSLKKNIVHNSFHLKFNI